MNRKKKYSKTLRFICWKSAYTIKWHTNVTRFYVIRRSIPFVLIFITKINWNCKDVANRVKYFRSMMMNVKKWWPNVDYKIKETLNRFFETKSTHFVAFNYAAVGLVTFPPCSPIDFCHFNKTCRTTIYILENELRMLRLTSVPCWLPIQFGLVVLAYAWGHSRISNL